MKKKKILVVIIGIVILLVIALIPVWNMMFSYSNVLEKNWGISIPFKSKYKEIYKKDSGASFHGDGIRYHIFSYEYEDYIDLMFAWDGTDNDNTIFHSSYSEAVSEWLKEIDVPEKYYPNYENCSFKYKSQDDNSELIILWDSEQNKLYIVESFM